MNLDRFAVGLADPQEVEEVAECDNCHRELYKGNEVIRYEGDLFCDTSCLGEFLIQNADFEDVIL